MTNQTPEPGCLCAVCQWANRRIAADAAREQDLADNYQKYLDGDLVSKDDRE